MTESPKILNIASKVACVTSDSFVMMVVGGIEIVFFLFCMIRAFEANLCVHQHSPVRAAGAMPAAPSLRGLNDVEKLISRGDESCASTSRA